MRFVRNCVVIAACAAGLWGCQSSAPGGRVGSNTIPTLTADEASAAGLSTQQVSDATSLYAAKCMRCHKFYEPTDYSQQEWDTWLHKMSRKSKLKPAQEELLTRYLAAYRAKQTPAALK